MRLLNEAEEDIERSLSLAGDVDEIKSDSLNSVEKAEEIALSQSDQKSLGNGPAEVELGSLREAKHYSVKQNKEQMKSSNGGKRQKKQLERVLRC